MTNEEREAIERLNKGVNDILFGTLYSQEEEDEDIETVLNLIQKQQAEIRQYEKALHDQIIKDYDMEIKLKDELEKKDKIIDLMADNIYEDDSNLGYYLCRKNGKCTKEMIIEYFKRKVEDK